MRLISASMHWPCTRGNGLALLHQSDAPEADAWSPPGVASCASWEHCRCVPFSQGRIVFVRIICSGRPHVPTSPAQISNQTVAAPFLRAFRTAGAPLHGSSLPSLRCHANNSCVVHTGHTQLPALEASSNYDATIDSLFHFRLFRRPFFASCCCTGCCKQRGDRRCPSVSRRCLHKQIYCVSRSILERLWTRTM